MDKENAEMKKLFKVSFIGVRVDLTSSPLKQMSTSQS